MELVKNKASGKFFIVIDDTGDKYIKLITLEGKVKFLDRHLFEPQASADHKDSLYIMAILQTYRGIGIWNMKNTLIIEYLEIRRSGNIHFNQLML
jgi:hypothetical protein